MNRITIFALALAVTACTSETPESLRETGGTLHRIDPAIVIEDMTAAGFELEGQSDLLRNPDDDHSKSVFDPELRGKTDRFVMRFRNPG